MRSVLTSALVSIAASLSLMLLSSCSKDELARRKHACADYVKFKVLEKGDVQRCITEESFFKAAAKIIADRETENIYPILLEDTKRMALSSSRLDKTSFKELPPKIARPDLFSDELSTMNWHVAVDLSSVMFDAPNHNPNLKSDWWEVSGVRTGEENNFWNLKIIGIGPYDFAGLETICPMLAYFRSAHGCTARLYVDVDSDSNPSFPDLAVMAIDFTPPTKDEVREILMEKEMWRWQPTPVGST